MLSSQYVFNVERFNRIFARENGLTAELFENRFHPDGDQLFRGIITEIYIRELHFDGAGHSRRDHEGVPIR